MAVEEPGQDPSSPQDARLDSLEKRLARAEVEETKRIGTAPAADANEQLGNRVLSTLIGGVFGGAIVGYTLDRVLGTGHKLLILMAVLGTVGGFWIIIKMANEKR